METIEHKDADVQLIDIYVRKKKLTECTLQNELLTCPGYLDRIKRNIEKKIMIFLIEMNGMLDFLADGVRNTQTTLNGTSELLKRDQEQSVP